MTSTSPSLSTSAYVGRVRPWATLTLCASTNSPSSPSSAPVFAVVFVVDVVVVVVVVDDDAVVP